jgi:hypothetical protein
MTIKRLNLKQTALAIDILKDVPFLSLDIHGDILLKKHQQKELERRLEEIETNFLSEIYNVKPKVIYFEDTVITSHDHNPLEHGIGMNPKLLSGQQIVKIGFSDIYGRVKGKRDLLEGTVNILEINPIIVKKETIEYLLEIINTEEGRFKEKDKKILKEYELELHSLIRKNIY